MGAPRAEPRASAEISYRGAFLLVRCNFQGARVLLSDLGNDELQVLRPTHLCVSRQLADRDAGKDIPESGLCALPDRMNAAPGLAFAIGASCQALVEVRGTFHSLNDLKERSFVAVHTESEAAAIAAMRSDKASMLEALHDLGEKAAAKTGSVFQANELGLGTRRQSGKVDHDADSIVGSAIDLHSPKMDLSRPVVGAINTQMRLGCSTALLIRK
jgi:hypothetical protein